MFPWSYLTLFLLIAAQVNKAAQRCAEFTDLNLGHAFLGTSVKVRLLLYTRENSTCATLLSHSNLSACPQLNLSRPTTFIIHGYRPTGSPPVWVHDLTDLVLARKDVNVIVVDWNHGAANVNYLKVVENTKKAGANITAFIEKMQEHGGSPSSIHMIGVSLGAHISGFVGANLNGSIGRISALDPAGPQFTGTGPEDRLDPTDAEFVDVLHTDMDALGYREPLGHIDFYANGGADQPGCPKTIFSGTSYFKCDHQRSVGLYLGSLNHTCASRAFPCSSNTDFLDGKCLSCDQFGAAGCPVFGYDVTQWKSILLKLGQTKTFFTTNAESPYCITGYQVDVMIWNMEPRQGYITIKLHYNGTEAVANIDHKSSEFKKNKETRLFAQFDKDVEQVEKVSVKFSTGKPFQPKYKLRILRIRLTHLELQATALCRYDVTLEENSDVTFRPIPCEESNF
ncbi:lipase member H-like [Solea senegalensis]|nr:lipase member H isoform X1 [Solea senegalensis]KAG7485558.1 lipase member H-like [Solea senegalensis]